MGAPGYTVFCSGGHIVKMVPHHYIDNTEVRSCKYCGSKILCTVMEWGDPDYDSWGLVPIDPIDHLWYKVNTDTIRGEVKVPVYDVSKLEHWRDYS